MAPRQTARRLLVAAPVLALAFAVTACTPPNEQPANPDAPYTLPTYTGDPEVEETVVEVEVVEVPEGEAIEESETTGVPTPGFAATPAQPGF